MIFNVMTLFPGIIEEYINTSIIKRALQKGIITVNIYNIRDFSSDKHKKTDDYPYGGGKGMLMTAQPICDCYDEIVKEHGKTRLIYFTPCGKTYSNQTAKSYAKLDSLTFLCGHYEGIDERIIELIVDEEISAGDFVLTGGELPALIVLDSVSRKINGVLSSDESFEKESFEDNLLEYPQYTRPEVYKGLRVPEVLLSGNHQKIQEWRAKKSIQRTKQRRPDLYLKNSEE